MSAPTKRCCGIMYFPMAYTVLASLLVFGLILVIGEVVSQLAAASLFFLLEAWVIYLTVAHTIDYSQQRVSGWLGVVAFFDLVIVQGLGSAGVWTGIYALDPTQFLLAAPFGSTSFYRIYVRFLVASFGLLGTVGYAIVVPSGVWAELWSVIGVLQSIWWLTILVSTGMRAQLR